jgi:hypothetical protein
MAGAWSPMGGGERGESVPVKLAIVYVRFRSFCLLEPQKRSPFGFAIGNTGHSGDSSGSVFALGVGGRDARRTAAGTAALQSPCITHQYPATY